MPILGVVTIKIGLSRPILGPLLRQALRFAGRRNLLEEYGETLLEIAQLRPTGGLVEWLVQAMLADVKALGLESLAAMLRAQQ